MAWTRERTSGAMTPITGYQDQTLYSTGATVRVANYSTGLVGSTRRTRDVPTPNFKKRRQMGETIINPFSSLVETRTCGLNGWAYFTTKPPYTGDIQAAVGTAPRFYLTVPYRPLTSYSPMTTSEMTDLRTLASTQAMANVSKPDVEGAVFLAEFGKTVKLLNDRVNLMRKILKGVVQMMNRTASRSQLTRRFSPSELASFVSNEWLKYRYGIRPLMKDIDDAIKLLQKKTKSDIRVARGFAALSRSVTSPPVTYSDSIYSYVATNTQSGTYSARAGVRYRVTGSVDSWGVSVANTPSVVWELLPYSFVVDWFLNTSQVIRALQPKLNVEILGTWITTNNTSKLTRHIVATQHAIPGVSSTVFPGGYDSHEVVHIQRSPDLAIGIAMNPTWSESFKQVTRIADAVSLSYQLLMRIGK